ncbi:MAG: glycoside hydrolase family 76 protein [Chloroflexota bacterium]
MNDQLPLSGQAHGREEPLRRALAVQVATRRHLQFPARGALAYRRSDAEPHLVDQWYLASQLWADAVLLPLLPAPAAASTRSDLISGFAFLEHLWDRRQTGYCPRCQIDGSGVTRETRYTDDNAVAGLALLAAASTLPTKHRDQLLGLAQREAAYLTNTRVWDNTFGGGYWWNTDLGNTAEGKPAQTNALAALFLARLAAATGIPGYRDWAVAIVDWLDVTLWDPARSLYRWSMAYQHPESRGGGAIVVNRYFNYDQAIAIEAKIALADLIGSSRHRAQAIQIGHALHSAFWDDTLGGYDLEAGVPQVFTSYGAWASLGHLALYELTGEPHWHAFAQGNVAAMDRHLGQPDGSYACSAAARSGSTVTVDRTRDTAAQAWAQHLLARLAALSLVD